MVVVDIVGPTTCDVLDSDNYRLILKEVQDGVFDCVGIATPCETLSPLREIPQAPSH